MKIYNKTAQPKRDGMPLFVFPAKFSSTNCTRLGGQSNFNGFDIFYVHFGVLFESWKVFHHDQKKKWLEFMCTNCDDQQIDEFSCAKKKIYAQFENAWPRTHLACMGCSEMTRNGRMACKIRTHTHTQCMQCAHNAFIMKILIFILLPLLLPFVNHLLRSPNVPFEVVCFSSSFSLWKLAKRNRNSYDHIFNSHWTLLMLFCVYEIHRMAFFTSFFSRIQ